MSFWSDESISEDAKRMREAHQKDLAMQAYTEDEWMDQGSEIEPEPDPLVAAILDAHINAEGDQRLFDESEPH